MTFLDKLAEIKSYFSALDKLNTNAEWTDEEKRVFEKLRGESVSKFLLSACKRMREALELIADGCCHCPDHEEVVRKMDNWKCDACIASTCLADLDQMKG